MRSPCRPTPHYLPPPHPASSLPPTLPHAASPGSSLSLPRPRRNCWWGWWERSQPLSTFKRARADCALHCRRQVCGRRARCRAQRADCHCAGPEAACRVQDTLCGWGAGWEQRGAGHPAAPYRSRSTGHGALDTRPKQQPTGPEVLGKGGGNARRPGPHFPGGLGGRDSLQARDQDQDKEAARSPRLSSGLFRLAAHTRAPARLLSRCPSTLDIWV